MENWYKNDFLYWYEMYQPIPIKAFERLFTTCFFRDASDWATGDLPRDDLFPAQSLTTVVGDLLQLVVGTCLAHPLILVMGFDLMSIKGLSSQ